MKISHKNDLEKFTMFIREGAENLSVYGTGEAARLIWNCVTKYFNITIKSFIDRKAENNCCGISVIELDEVPEESYVIIAADPLYGIEQRLEENGLTNWIYVDPIMLHRFCFRENYLDNNAKQIKNNKIEIERVKSMLFDDFSKEVFIEMLSQRVNPNMRRIKLFNRGRQYFENDLIPNITGNIVDCGAFKGDTLDRYVKQTNNDKWHYYALEADKENCEVIKKYVRDKNLDKRVSIYNLGVWDKKTVLESFNCTETNEKTSGKVIEVAGTDGVPADSLDSIFLQDTTISGGINLVTMDIEGAEIHALEGAEKLVQKYHPILAISCYHEIDHMWKIPLQISELYSGYRLFIRHHRWNVADTVCYAISDSNFAKHS